MSVRLSLKATELLRAANDAKALAPRHEGLQGITPPRRHRLGARGAFADRVRDANP
jgi:hypothetical protein